MIEQGNLALLTDLYEYTMANGFQHEMEEERGSFDIFFRKLPDNGRFVVLAGIGTAIEELQKFHFDEEDLDYLRGLEIFSDKFLDYLRNFKFACKVSAITEGTPVFPREPVVTVEGPLIQAQLFETLLLNIINHQTLIATKARRIVAAAKGRTVMEFGARRAQGPASAVYGARAAVIGGCTSTSNMLAGQKFGIPVAGTMAHSWIEAFDDELSAFEAWGRIYPNNCSLLVDTYDVLGSGVPNAIKVFDQLSKQGYENFGIRIDSGDITQLSTQAREMLDLAGYNKATITASNALDEEIIQSLMSEGAAIDNFGVGENLITSASSPVLSGVYKLGAVQKADGRWVPKVKVSASIGKLTLPGRKQVYRLYDPRTGSPIADLVTLRSDDIPENIEEMKVLSADPEATKRFQTLKNVTAVTLQKEFLNEKGELQTELPNVFEVQKYSKAKLAELPSAKKRLLYPDEYPVYITESLYDQQQELIENNSL
ncbi:nicotinate phosphoribosyltransferase [Ligilactobacillus salitolerans]|uniref:Nicotinate phosphoribosyltransferase n=1 Tax=Ligilactobacillus salitolerans TaxID=1808352 RepID=A0A401ISG5_9LACO|nr:nicotinate phosphoribosyltransferase [Ligilactobacillus salitolerans]GBG94456.1 nicotinate phosphoribosyltransferase [Ligilactobacillus salitolerans]